jgi:hypothetical protein
MEMFPDFGGGPGFGAAQPSPSPWYHGQQGMVPQQQQQQQPQQPQQQQLTQQAQQQQQQQEERRRRQAAPEALAAAAAAGAEAAIGSGWRPAAHPKSSSGTDSAYPHGQRSAAGDGQQQAVERPRRQAAGKRTYALSGLEGSEADSDSELQLSGSDRECKAWSSRDIARKASGGRPGWPAAWLTDRLAAWRLQVPCRWRGRRWVLRPLGCCTPGRMAGADAPRLSPSPPPLLQQPLATWRCSTTCRPPSCRC